MWKKILLCALALLMTLSLFGCGGQKDLMASGEIEEMKAYVEERAKLGRQLHLTELRQWNDVEELGDIDVYGNIAITVIYMPKKEVRAKELALANKILRKVCGYATTDIPPSKKDNVAGEIDFAANRLVRALYAPDGRIEDETAEALKRFFLNDDFQSCYYSENHMLMFRAARYLAACYFEDETFNQYNMTGAELRQQEHDYLVEFLQYRAKRGWGEFDSMGYVLENFLSVLNLYDCAADEDLRELAKMTLDTLLMNMVVDMTNNGMYGGAHGRSYDAVATNMRCRCFFLYQLYFGETGLDDVPESTKEVGISNAPLAFVSDYRPHDIIYAIVAQKVYPFSNYEEAHNPATQFEHVDYGRLSKYTYNTELYSIGCVNRQEPYPDDSKDKKTEDTQQTNWSLVFAENSKASITVHHPGGTNSHNYWYGDAQCNCNHLFGHENVVTGIFYIPNGAGDYPYLHAHLEKEGFDEIEEDAENGKVFVRLGDAYAVLRFSDEYSWKTGTKDEILISDGDRTYDIRIAMVCEAGDKATYGSFDKFKKAMNEKEFDFDRGSLTLYYDNMKLVLTEKGEEITESHSLNGEQVTYPYGYVYDSYMMKSEWDSGVVEMYYGDYVRTMDFMNITDTVDKKESK